MANDTLDQIWGKAQASPITETPDNPGSVSSEPHPSSDQTAASSLSSIWGKSTSASYSPIPDSGKQNLSSIWGSSTNPEPSRDESDRFTQEDPGDNWLGKVWTGLNKPLTESLFGWGQYRQGAGGLERGVEKIASGFSSPLSILTLAAFAPASVAESVAGTVLKDGLVNGADMLGGDALSGLEASAKVENYGKAVQAAKKAQIAGKSIQDAVSSATGGALPYQEFLNYGSYLRNQGLKETDMLGESLARRVASSGLQKVGVTPAKAMNVAKGAETLVNAGFGVQMVHGALYAYPRVLDELQNGEYDAAAEHMVEAGVGTIFGTLGLAHSLHSAQDLIPGLNEKANLPLADETQALDKLFGHYQGILGEDNIKIADRLRNHTLQMLDAAGVEAPANLKLGDWGTVSPLEEISSAWRNILTDQASREKVSNTQKLMFFLMDNGGDRQLSHQESRALIYAYHLEDWAKDNLGEYLPPERTLENITNEQISDRQNTKADITINTNELQKVRDKITNLSQILKEEGITKEQADSITKSLDEAKNLQNELQLHSQELAKKWDEVKDWEHPTEATWAKHYENLLNQIREVVKPLESRKEDIRNGDKNALEEFNKAVNVLGFNRNDLDIIEKQYPNFIDNFQNFKGEREYSLDRGMLPKDYKSPEMELPPEDYVSKIREAREGKTPEVRNELDYIANIVKEHGLDLEGLLRTTPISDETLRALRDIDSEHFPVTEGLLQNVDTEEFKKFFRDSQAKKIDGTPAVFYHGTTALAPSTYEGPTKTLDELKKFISVANLDHDISVQEKQAAMHVASQMMNGKSFEEAMGLEASPFLAKRFGGSLSEEETPHDFNSFDTKNSDLGTHLGSPEQANSFVMRPSEEGLSDNAIHAGRVMPVYARIENPLRLSDRGIWNKTETVSDLVNKGILSKEEGDKINAITDKQKRNLKIQAAIKKAGFDGVVYLNRTEGIGKPVENKYFSWSDRNYVSDNEFRDRYPTAHDSYIVFDPDQVKSVFNNNFGEGGELSAKISDGAIFTDTLKPEDRPVYKEYDQLKKQVYISEYRYAKADIENKAAALQELSKAKDSLLDFSDENYDAVHRIDKALFDHYNEMRGDPDEVNARQFAYGPFYYKTPEIIDNKIKGPLQGPQFLKTLQNNGVKSDELYWTGLENLLKENRKFTPEEVKEWIRSHQLDIHEVSRGAVMGKNPHPKVSPEEWLKAHEEGKHVYYTLPDDPHGPFEVDNHEGGYTAKAVYQDMIADRNLEDLISTPRFDLYVGNPEEIPRQQSLVKYGKYTIPGGENNRELLVTAPNLSSKFISPEMEKFLNEIDTTSFAVEPEQNADGTWDLVEPIKGTKGGFKYKSESEALRDFRDSQPDGVDRTFHSSHWDQKNVLAHVRYNDRVTPDGKRLLHLEELQSDWHQQGRTHGYQRELPPEERQAIQDKISEHEAALGDILEKRSYIRERADLSRAIGKLTGILFLDNHGTPGFTFEDAKLHADIILNGLHRYTPEDTYPERTSLKISENAKQVIAEFKKNREDDRILTRQAIALRTERNRLENSLRNEEGVPNAPFKKTWSDLLVKRMIHYAAENGYDGVSWSPGEEHITRYPSLADYGDTVAYEPKSRVLSIYKEGLFQNAVEVPEGKLVDTIGKEPAKKLLESELKPLNSLPPEDQEKIGYHLGDPDTAFMPKHFLTGSENLKIGGAGMRGFYDKIVPDMMNNIGKRFGVKVEKTSIGPTSDAEVLLKQEAVIKQRLEESRKVLDPIKDQYDEAVYNFYASHPDIPNLDKAKEEFGLTGHEIVGKYYDALRDTSRLVDEFVNINRKTENLQGQRKVDVQYLPLNEELKSSVLEEGFPMFKQVHDDRVPPSVLNTITERLGEIDQHLKNLYQITRDTERDGVIKSLKAEAGKLQDQFNTLLRSNVGSVRELPSGKKVMYASQWVIKMLMNLAHPDRESNLYTEGLQIPSKLVDDILSNLKKLPTDTGFKDRISEFIKKGRNPKSGSLIVSEFGNNKGIGYTLATLREELSHDWQESLTGKMSSHLKGNQWASLYAEIPTGLRRYILRNYREVKKPLFVFESAAKILAEKDLGNLGITPEEGAAFLHKYFTEVTKTHGDNALDNLVHVTAFGKRLKEEFLDGLRKLKEKQSASNRGEGETPVEGMAGEGGAGAGSVPPGGGDGEGPPVGPPPEPEWWRKPYQTSSFKQSPWLDGPLHQAIPTDVFEKVEKTRGKGYSPEHLDYVKNTIKILSDIASRELTDKEKALYRTLRDSDDDNWAVGYNKGIIKSIVDNHVHHIWGEEEDPSNSVRQVAGSGAFAINASQAKHRSWGTAFEGILGGRQLAVHDPASIIAHDANNISKAAANREFLSRLAESGLKDSEGMPIAVYYGRGFHVSGEDGSNAAILVNPHIVRNIIMDPQEISRLERANLLQQYIKDGRVVDKTPQVDQGNVQGWIDSTDKKLKKLEEQNPLLASNIQKMDQHKAAWGQIQYFAQQQAQKIATYLADAIDDIKHAGTTNGKDFLPVPKNTPDFNMAKYMSQVLHGETGRKISPPDLARLEEYLKRNQQYAQGLSSRRDINGNLTSSPIRPYEVARLLLQEREHLDNDPELKEYFNQVHQTLGTDWSRQGVNNAIYHIAHAAENPQYEQLTRDLADLKHVDKVYTSVNPITQQEHREEAENLLKDINARQPKQYLWAPKNHIVVDHPSFHGYKWMATAADGTPTLAESSMGVSPEYYKYIVNRLGLEPSWLRKPEGIGKITSAILRKGAAAKSILLSGSPFHVIQEALRGLMLSVNPLVRPNPLSTLNEGFKTVRGNIPVLKLGVENNLTLFNNRFSAEDYSVGVASHLSDKSVARKIPGVSHYLRFSDEIHDLLFNRMIPQLKANGFRKMFDKYASAHPDWTNDAVAKAAAEHTNAAFGGINWRAMGRSAATQDWFHLLALAPDWLESEMRFAAGAFKGLGIGPAKYEPDHGRNFTRTQIAGTAATMWVVARVLNQLYSGNAHYETPFGLATKDKEGREIEVSFRTMPTDIMHMASDPYGFLVGRESPFVRTALEAYTGRNEYGQKLQASEKYVDLLSNLAPIWAQAVGKDVTGLSTASDVGMAGQVGKSAGATVRVYRTPAQKTAVDQASQRSEEGSMTPATVMRHRLLLQLEDDMRSGRIQRNDLQEMVNKGNLPMADAKNVIKVVSETVGEDQETAKMYSRVSRMDWAGALSVWDDANPSEKKVLGKLIIKKANSYIKKSYSDFTPREREADPLLKRALRISPPLKKQSSQ